MCGIAGTFITNEFLVDKDIIFNSIKNRGPDASGHTSIMINQYSVDLFHTRLTIIDLDNRANQPMEDSDAGNTIVFNGEIYNYLELKKILSADGCEFKTNSDTEVILQGYKLYGSKFFCKLRGMYAFCILDNKNSKAFLCRDRIGVKPLYFANINENFFFASNLTAISETLKKNNFNLKTNLESFNNYLKKGYTFENYSIIQDIDKVNPGTYVQLDLSNGKVFDEHIDEDYKPLIPKQNFSKQYIKDLLISAVESRLVADVEVGIFLSGGYDSSLVTAIAKKELNKDIPAFTIGFSNKSFDESSDATKIADYLDIPHKIKICSPEDASKIIPLLPKVYDEPFGDSSSIPTILLSKFVSKHVKVALSADGGDELFGGYRKYLNSIKLSRMIRFIRPLSFLIKPEHLKFFPVNIMRKYSGFDLNTETLKKALNIIHNSSSIQESSYLIENSIHSSKILQNILEREFYEECDHLLFDKKQDSISEMLFQDIKTYLPSDIMVKVDRASMYFGLEAREPLLDHDLVKASLKMANDQKIKDKSGKVILKEICHEYIPSEIMDRPKKGFGVPVREWMRRDLRYLFDECFIDDVEILNEFNKEELIKIVTDYYKGNDSFFTLLWYIFRYYQWKKEWLQ